MNEVNAVTSDQADYAMRWKTLGVLSLSLVIIGLDNTILNVALPTLQDEFDASASKLQWMVDSYLLVFAGQLLVFGVVGAVPAAKTGVASATNTVARNLRRAEDSVGAASGIAAQLPPDAASDLLNGASKAFTDAMGSGLLIPAALAAATAVVVARFLPDRDRIRAEPEPQAAEPGLLPLAELDRVG